MHQDPDGFFLDAGRHGREHLVAAQLILYQRISLGKGLQADTLAKLIHIVDMVHPLPVDDLQKEDALQLTQHLRIRELGFLQLIKLHRLFLEHMLQLIPVLLLSDALRRNGLQGNGPKQSLVQAHQIPVRLLLIVSNQAVHHVLHRIRNHLIDSVAHALAIQHPAPLAIDNLALLVHDLVILQQVLTNAEVVALDLLLRLLNGVRQHLMLNLLILRHAQRVEHSHQTLGAEETHQVVLQGNIETGLARVALTSGTAAQLVVDTSGLMALRTDDL